MFVGIVTDPGETPEQRLFCQQQNAVTAQNMGIATNQNGWQPRPEEWYIQQSTLQQQAFEAANRQNTTLLSEMPVPSPVSHAKQQADARIAELEAKLAAAEEARADLVAQVAVQGAVILSLAEPIAWEEAPNPFANALSAWPGRGGVDQWSGMPLSVGRSFR